jgi:hypothetical protein
MYIMAIKSVGFKYDSPELGDITAILFDGSEGVGKSRIEAVIGALENQERAFNLAVANLVLGNAQCSGVL